MKTNRQPNLMQRLVAKRNNLIARISLLQHDDARVAGLQADLDFTNATIARIVNLRHAEALRIEQENRIRRQSDEVQTIVMSGRCPLCGSGLRRNSSLAGWWQCEQYGAPSFRADADKPACSWQGFVVQPLQTVAQVKHNEKMLARQRATAEMLVQKERSEAEAEARVAEQRMNEAHLDAHVIDCILNTLLPMARSAGIEVEVNGLRRGFSMYNHFEVSLAGSPRDHAYISMMSSYDFATGRAPATYGVNWSAMGTQEPEFTRSYAKLILVLADFAEVLQARVRFVTLS
jgi:hypothetical protein